MSLAHRLGRLAKLAKLGLSYSYSNTQVDLPADLARRVREWGRKHIPDSDLHVDGEEYGREDEIHVTVKYGLHTAKPGPVQQLLHDAQPFKISLGKVSRFTKDDDYDVMKIAVEGEGLRQLHTLLTSSLSNTDKHPRYQPHITIAYVRKGCCAELVGQEPFAEEMIEVNQIVFSSKSGGKTTIKLEGTKEAAYDDVMYTAFLTELELLRSQFESS